MDFNYDREAKNNLPVPEGLSGAEIKAYISIRALYQQYDKGDITIETAKADKLAVLNQLRYEKVLEDSQKSAAEMLKRIGEPARVFSMDPTIENANILFARIYNLPDDWREHTISQRCKSNE